MSVPSCPLALTNPIQLHTLRCSGGPYAPKSSHRHAKTCLFPSRYQLDMCFTYIDELILAQIEDSCSWELLRESRTNLRKTKRLLARSSDDRRHFLSMANIVPARCTCATHVLASQPASAQRSARRQSRGRD